MRKWRGAKMLEDFPPRAMIRLKCDKCGRRGQYRAETLIARYGADTPMPTLLGLIAQCPRYGKAHDPCQVVYDKALAKGDYSAARGR